MDFVWHQLPALFGILCGVKEYCCHHTTGKGYDRDGAPVFEVAEKSLDPHQPFSVC